LGQATVASRSANRFGVGLGVHDRKQLLHVVDLGQVDAVGFGAEIVIRCDREGTEMAEPAGNVFHPFVQAEDFHTDEDDGRVRNVGRSGGIDRHIAALDRNGGHAGVEAFGISLDDVGAHRTGGERIARGSSRRTRHKAAPRQWRHDL
jgi:hypothetical protein